MAPVMPGERFFDDAFSRSPTRKPLRPALTELAILAASAIKPARPYRGVAFRLASYAGADTGECLTPARRDVFAAIVAMFGAIPRREARTRANHRV